MSDVYIGERELWKRPFTAKRYIHPPLSEEVITMWPDGKILFEEVNTKIYSAYYTASAFKILLGESHEEIDFKKVKYETDPSGIPVHAFTYEKSGVVLRMESFCSIERSPVAFVKLSFINRTKSPVCRKYSLIARTGNIVRLMGVEQDGYAHLNTNLGNWGFIPTEFVFENDRVHDGAVTLELFGAEDCRPRWRGNLPGVPWRYRGLLEFDIELGEGADKEIVLAFYRTGKEAKLGSYEEEKAKAVGFWERELARIKIYPRTNRKNYRTMYRTLVANSLQMFARPKGETYTIARQGGTQNNIWPAEAVYMFRALDRIGDFSFYTEQAIDFYLDKLYVSEGEEKGSFHTLSGSIGWASDSAAILETISWHIYYGSAKTYEKYKDRALEIYQWIEKKRSETKNGEFAGKGLFPPMRSCDWEDVMQTWTKTDAFHLQAIGALIRAFEKYGHPALDEIRRGREDYLACMRAVLDKLACEYKDCDEIVVPMHVGKPAKEPQTEGPFVADGVNLIVNGVCDPESETAAKIEKYYINRCMFKNGLHGLMNCGLLPGHQWDPWAGHVWYTGFVDQSWFDVFMAQGRKKEAEETLNAQLTYSMTREYSVCERYCDSDPYFVPWLPNASGNGRIINMLLDFYGI